MAQRVRRQRCLNVRYFGIKLNAVPEGLPRHLLQPATGKHHILLLRAEQ